MSHKTDAYAGQHPDDLRKAKADLALIHYIAQQKGIRPAPWVNAAVVKVHSNLRELQRLARLDAQIQ